MSFAAYSLCANPLGSHQCRTLSNQSELFVLLQLRRHSAQLWGRIQLCYVNLALTNVSLLRATKDIVDLHTNVRFHHLDHCLEQVLGAPNGRTTAAKVFGSRRRLERAAAAAAVEAPLSLIGLIIYWLQAKLR